MGLNIGKVNKKDNFFDKEERSIVENTILLHHEKWNGTGYPFGLKGHSIPVEARIVAIVDCYDALTSDRIYKSKLSHEKALEILKNESGKVLIQI